MLVFFMAIASVCKPSLLYAQEEAQPKIVQINWKSKQPHLSFSVEQFLSAHVKQKIESGLPQNLSIKVFAHHQKNPKQLLSAATITCKVIYDLWEEKFHIQQRKNLEEQHFISNSIEGVKQKCFQVRSLALEISSNNFKPTEATKIWFSIEVEFNPLSDAEVEKIRYWLSRSSRTSRDQLFGSLVSFFVNQRIGRAERISRFHSQTVTVPK